MKKNWRIVPVLLLAIAGIALSGCDQLTSETDNTWTLSQDSGVETGTTHIIITFNEAIDTLPASIITITGAAAKDPAAGIEGSGTTWSIPVIVSIAGDATVSIITNDLGIEVTSKKIEVYKAEASPDEMAGYTLKSVLGFGESYTAGDNDGLKVWDFNNDVITTLEGAKKGSKIRVHLTVNEDSVSHGIGGVGIVDGQMLASLNGTGTTSFYTDMWVSWVLDKLGEGTTLSVITYADKEAVLDKVQLFEPDGDVEPDPIPTAPKKPAHQDKTGYILVQEISTTGGAAADITTGKGNIEGEDLAALVAAEDGSYLRLYMRNMSDPYESRNGWGIGKIGTIDLTGADISADERDFIIDIKISDLITDVNVTYIFVNIWDCAVTMAEIFKPDPNYVEPSPFPYSLKVEENTGGGNYQGMLAEDWVLDGGEKITKDQTYEMSIAFSSDTAIDKLAFIVADNTEAAGWWKPLSGDIEIKSSIVAGEAYTQTITFTATETATDNTAAANKIAIYTTDATVSSTVTLTITAFTLSKKDSGGTPEIIDLGVGTPAEGDNAANQLIWTSGTWAWSKLFTAKYLVIESKGSANNDGFAGMQLVLQDNENWAWGQNNLNGDWISFAHTADETVYICIELNKLNDYSAMETATGGNVFFASYPVADVGLQKVMLTDKALEKPGSAVELKNEKVDDADTGKTFGFITTDASIF